MDEVVIKAEGVSKRYRIGLNAASTGRYTALRDVIARNLQGVARSTRDILAGRALVQGDTVQDFWALRDVSFSVRRGEILGVIGRNGAGKSTLLKILSRITEPSAGMVRISGRVATLLEVGTGFHPELTGRENIFLNGAILGMTRAEIRERFDEIVAFAEVTTFLDTPVKRYSSGMYVRLAFAVAAHLNPEILVIDEVLAVGDAAFQKKCLGKMVEVSRGGRTVLFVSHNMSAVQQLTQRSLVLAEGCVVLDAPTSEAVAHYMEAASSDAGGGEWVRKHTDALTRQSFFVSKVTTSSNFESGVSSRFECDDPITIRVFFTVRGPVPGLYGYLQLHRIDGTLVLEGDSFDAGVNPLEDLPVGDGMLEIMVPPRTLGHGRYLVYLNFTDRVEQIDCPGTVADFVIGDSRTRRGNSRQGFLSSLSTWAVRA